MWMYVCCIWINQSVRTRSKTLKPNFNSTSGLTKIGSKRGQFNSVEKLIRFASNNSAACCTIWPQQAVISAQDKPGHRKTGLEFHFRYAEKGCQTSATEAPCNPGEKMCVHLSWNVGKLGQTIYAKRDAIFYHWITRRFRRARLTSIFGIPEVEFESGFTMPRSVLGGDAHFRCDAVKTDVDFLCAVFAECCTLNVECRTYRDARGKTLYTDIGQIWRVTVFLLGKYCALLRHRAIFSNFGSTIMETIMWKRMKINVFNVIQALM